MLTIFAFMIKAALLQERKMQFSAIAYSYIYTK